MEPIDRVFNLMAYGTNQPTMYVAITPTSTQLEVVVAAWSYAVRYTAKGLDLPDYEEAVKMLIQRHPSWTAFESRINNIAVTLAKAETDVPEDTTPQ